MKPRTLKQLQNLYMFAEKRAVKAGSIGKYRVAGRWNNMRLHILDIAVRDGKETYTHGEFFSIAN